jgi:hypothetical protein
MFPALALSALLALHYPQESKPQEPRTAPVVGSVDVNTYIETKAKLISLEAQLKDCQERVRRRHFLIRIFGALFRRR